MNNTRRKEIKKVIATLEELNSIIENLQSEEGDAMDAISENFSETDQYAHMEECYDFLGDVISDIEDIISTLEKCIG